MDNADNQYENESRQIHSCAARPPLTAADDEANGPPSPPPSVAIRGIPAPALPWSWSRRSRTKSHSGRGGPVPRSARIRLAPFRHRAWVERSRITARPARFSSPFILNSRHDAQGQLSGLAFHRVMSGKTEPGQPLAPWGMRTTLTTSIG